jgi:hypothetical protein
VHLQKTAFMDHRIHKRLLIICNRCILSSVKFGIVADFFDLPYNYLRKDGLDVINPVGVYCNDLF